MLVHPWLPNVTPVPQYAHVITISPNLGAIGAPQLGHFKDETPEGATTGPEEPAADVLEDFNFVLAPHLVQNSASSES